MATYTGVDTNDKQLTNITKAEQTAINNSNKVYNQQLTDYKNLYNTQIGSLDTWEQTQNDILDKQLANETAKIEQQKETARQDTKTETNKALNDYDAYVNPYGYQAERIASSGLSNSGVSETSQLGAYTTYQNRVATANKALVAAIASYDNDINDAVLNNDVQKAQNSLTKLEKSLSYLSDYTNNKVTVNTNKLNNAQDLSDTYFNRYQTVYGNLQNEAANKLSADQYNENMAYQKARDAVSDAQWQQEFNENQRQYNESLAFEKQQYQDSLNATTTSSSGSSNSGSKKTSTAEVNTDYYTGSLNPDCKNGVFNTQDNNGVYYQPDNVGGAKLSKTGLTVDNNGITQNIWKTSDGKYYYWEGKQNKYIEITGSQKKSINLRLFGNEEGKKRS